MTPPEDLAPGRGRARRESCATDSPALGYQGELRESFADWAGAANLEERVDGVERIDPVVLDALRNQS